MNNVEFELSEEQALDAIRGLVRDTANQGDAGIEKLTQWIWAMEQQITNMVDVLQSSIEACRSSKDPEGSKGPDDPGMVVHVAPGALSGAEYANKVHSAMVGGKLVFVEEQKIPGILPQEDDGEPD